MALIRARFNAKYEDCRSVNEEEWLPIDSAPKDGRIIVALEDGEQHLMYWVWPFGWCVAYQLVKHLDPRNPTHWKPLSIITNNDLGDN